MGIPGLAEHLPPECMSSPVHVYAVAAGCVGLFDMSSLLHSAASSHEGKHDLVDTYVQQCVFDLIVKANTEYRILPICVFEPTEKPDPKRTRAEAMPPDGLQDAPDHATSATRARYIRKDAVQFALASQLTSRGFPCLMAPFEADAQLVALQQSEDLRDAAIFAYDYDLAILGARHFFLVTSFSRGTGRLYRSPQLLVDSGVINFQPDFPHFESQWALPALAAFSKSDYGNIAGVGLKTVTRFLRRHSSKTKASDWTPASLARAFFRDKEVQGRLDRSKSRPELEAESILVMQLFDSYPVAAVLDGSNDVAIRPLHDPLDDGVWGKIRNLFARTRSIDQVFPPPHTQRVRMQMLRGPDGLELPPLANLLAPVDLPGGLRALCPDSGLGKSVSTMTPQELTAARQSRFNVPAKGDRARKVLETQNHQAMIYPKSIPMILNVVPSVAHTVRAMGAIRHGGSQECSLYRQLKQLVKAGSFAPFFRTWHSVCDHISRQHLFLCSKEDVLNDTQRDSWLALVQPKQRSAPSSSSLVGVRHRNGDHFCCAGFALCAGNDEQICRKARAVSCVHRRAGHSTGK
eukprot:m.247999 g.247999  ORF g.247999 m.247999 type:complete len:576 (-) comp10969_c2_seq3:3553-5280(-)